MTQSKAFVPLKPIPIKDRVSMIFIQYGRIDVKDGAFAVVDEVNGERLLIAVGSVVCLMLEPGTRVSHAAVKFAATTGTLLIRVGQAAVLAAGYGPGSWAYPHWQTFVFYIRRGVFPTSVEVRRSQVDGKMAYRTRRPAHEYRQTRS